MGRFGTGVSSLGRLSELPIVAGAQKPWRCMISRCRAGAPTALYCTFSSPRVSVIFSAHT
jgi:hypothetical protein